MKYEINLLKVANQSNSCNLVDEKGNLFAVDFNLRTLMDGCLIIDITVDDEVQVLSSICCNKMPLMPTNILNGNLYFEDVFGDEDPYFEGFNDRFKLIYDTEFRLG